ncbi:MAG: zinc-binding dehydrogenase [Actinomycetota bacterium]
MRAAILRNGAMVVDDIPELHPGPSQVLVSTIACGICGSDLHAVDHLHDLVSTAQDVGSTTFTLDADRDLVMGHETSVLVEEVGSEVDGIRPGTAMTAMPALTTVEGAFAVPGYDNTYPGGFAQRMLLDPGALLPVPNGLDPVVAALTEPMAVGLHAVNQSSAAEGRGAIVIGAGPVGLAVIAALSVLGAEPIVASDFSARRRGLAAAMGAHVVLDPTEAADRRAGLEACVDVWRQGAPPIPGPDETPVLFEAVGVPGMIETTMTVAPPNSEIVVVGVCMASDAFRPSVGIFKRLALRFVLGWSPEEFAASMHHLAEGRIDGAAMVTGEVRLDEVPDAFRALGDPEEHIKILVRPNESD